MAETILVSKNSSALTDDVAVQAALDGIKARGGGVVRLTSGTYYVTQTLKIGDNTHLHLDQDARLVRQFAGGGLSQATIVNAGGSAGNSQIRISGGTIITLEATDSVQGKHLGFDNVKFLSIDNVRFPKVYKGWTAFFRDCEDVTISNLNIGDGTDVGDALQEDGLHFAGGSRIAVTNCNIYCGDDCIALVHELPADAYPSKPLTGFVASNCTLRSKNANAIRVLVKAEDPIPPTISKIRFSNIVAKIGLTASGRGIDITDKTGSDRISDVEIDGLTLDASTNALEGLLMEGVAHCRLANVTILKPKFRGALINGCTDIELRNVVLDGPRENGYACLTVANEADCTNIRILGGRYSNSMWHGIELGIVGGSSYKVNGFEISGALIEEAKLNGVLIWNAFDGVVVGNTIKGSGTLTTPGWGIEEINPPSDRNLIIGNQIADNVTGPIRFSGPNTEVARNFGGVTTKTADSGGFRQTIDGWNEDGLLIGAIGEIARNNFPIGIGSGGAGRFRAVRSGSITGIVITSSIARSNGTLTATVCINNTGVAGNPGAPTIVVATLDSTNTLRHPVTYAINQVKFSAGDEIYIELAASSVAPDVWSPTNALIRCAVEIED